MQPEYKAPEFIADISVNEIQERMMESLPADIDNTPGGFPYDFTMPSAIEKADIIEYYISRAIQLAFPEYAWDEFLDLHGKQVNLNRHPESYASGNILVTGEAGYFIEEGTVFCVPATEVSEAIEYATLEECEIGEDGTVVIMVQAVEPGAASNVKADSVSIMLEPVDEIVEVTNPEPITGGNSEESDDSLYDRIAVEYANSRTFLGNDIDYIRWSKEAGAGDCIVDAAAEGPGTVKLVLVDVNGQPANEQLIEDVYNYIVSPNDRLKRLLPTACAKLTCVAATSFKLHFTCTGILYSEITSLAQIQKEFEEMLPFVYSDAKSKGVLRYNDVRPLLSSIVGVVDFDEFYINDDIKNIQFSKEEYPETGSVAFS